MRIGTRSLLFGVHQIILHPVLVAIAWYRLYGFPWDPKLWLAFFLHDLGYWGKPNMDGQEGERHVELGARVMRWLFDSPQTTPYPESQGSNVNPKPCPPTWYHFMLFHSRFWSRQYGYLPSKLCYADKAVSLVYPRWLYMALGRMSGEIKEYILRSRGVGGYKGNGTEYSDMDTFFEKYQEWIRQYLLKGIGYDARTKTYTNDGSANSGTGVAGGGGTTDNQSTQP